MAITYSGLGGGSRARDLNVQADRTAEKSVFRYYQQLINLRHGPLPVPQDGRRHRLVLGNYSDPGEQEALRPWEARIHRLS